MPLLKPLIYLGSHIASDVSYSNLLFYVLLEHSFSGIEPTGAFGLWLEFFP